MIIKKIEEKLVKYLFELVKDSSKLPPLSKEENTILEAENNFKSVYFSNRLEGNQLTEEEARNAIFADDL